MAVDPKSAVRVYVTLPELGRLALLVLNPNTAVVPEKVVEVIAVPLAYRVTWVMLTGFPEPETVRVKPVMLTVEELGLVITTCWTVTPAVPGTTVALGGGLVPCVAATVTTVGVPLGVLVAVDVGVEVAVRVGVNVGVEVPVFVAVKARVLVDVAVGVRVAVLARVSVGVLVAVKVDVRVGVWV